MPISLKKVEINHTTYNLARMNMFLHNINYDQIMQIFDSKENIEYFAKSVEYSAIAANDYNLSVSSYVEAKDTREVIVISKLNAELKTTVAKIDQLRAEIDAIVAEIEGDVA